MARNYPFSAIVGQEDMKLAILIAALDSSVGGVLVMGDRGTGKSTAVRALAALLPEMSSVQDCVYACDPNAAPGTCPVCDELRAKLKVGGKLKAIKKAVPVVDLPLGATEDRVIGALDIEKALSSGEKAYEPGLLAKAHRGFLYIDEVNLLEDHLVDGGFGSWLLESAEGAARNRIQVRALDPTVCGAVASQGVLNEMGGIVDFPVK